MTDSNELDELITEITVDCYDEQEQLSGFFTAFTDEVESPLEATLLDITVLVIDFDVRESGRELTAHCRHGAAEAELALADLMFPADTVAAWLHAAYRRYLGLQPHPASRPAGWTLSWQ